jgi:carbon starvation protein
VNSALALVLSLAAGLFTYYVYARYIDQRVIQADPRRATPARLYMDGVDFMPTSKHVLFGYQFKSIAALGPVTGPIIAMQWGWLPAFLWVIFGTMLIGWVQDYTSIMIGVRNDGQTFGALSYHLISPRGRITLLAFIFFYLILIVAAFGKIVGDMMAAVPSVPVAIVALVIVGLGAGYLIYRKHADIVYTTLGMVVLALLAIWLGTVLPVKASAMTWVLFALAFSYAGAVLPIWLYGQPINYISFYLVFLGMIGAGIGVLVGHPDFTIPAFTKWTIPLGPIWPLLFVTVACGAISGWHSLVSSSGSARQLEKETDARYVGAGAMIAEMVLATLSIIIAAATFASFKDFGGALAKGPAFIFATGMSGLLNFLGISPEFGKAFAGAMYVILAITVMQLVLRVARLSTTELLGDYVPVMRNMYVTAALVAVICWILIATGTWQYIWTLFGGSNQLMAALALMLVSIWLKQSGRNWHFTFWPMLFMFVTTVVALLMTGIKLFRAPALLLAGKIKPPAGQTIGLAVAGNYVSGVIAFVLVLAAVVLAWDGLRVFFGSRPAAAGAQAGQSASTAD